MEDEEDADGDAGDEDEADGDLEADMDAFDDMDEDEDSDADDDDDMEGESWWGKRSDITKSRKTRFGPLAGLGAGGYFGDSLHSKLHHEERDSQERANVEALFELVTAEENVPCILYLKDTEKTLLTSYERYTHFKRQLDKISTPLVVIGSSIVSTKGKGDKAPGGGFLLSKSGGQTTLWTLRCSITSHAWRNAHGTPPRVPASSAGCCPTRSLSTRPRTDLNCPNGLSKSPRISRT